MTKDLEQLKEELQEELLRILRYWMEHTIDRQRGGFYGKIDNDNKVHSDSPKGVVLNARILWTFSAAFGHTDDKKYLAIADRAKQYISNHFFDQQYGGFYWSVDKYGNRLDDRKQVYGIAFCLYAFAEYYKVTNDDRVLQQAKDCYASIEQYSFDKTSGGYIEAFSRDWQSVEDLRLSVKDANEKKTMNTHLHVLEAYTNLYRVWKDENLRRSIQLLLQNFTDHITDRNTGHLHLFFDDNWHVKDSIISYGHDIEAAWLLLEAAEIIEDTGLLGIVKNLSLQIADAAAEGLDTDGGLWYEKEHDKLVQQKHSWPQAEAMVGFFNAWQLTGNKQYLEKVFRSWRFVQRYILDKKNGEWCWGIRDDYSVMKDQDKAGFWKCPYHNSRACLELIKRIQHPTN